MPAVVQFDAFLAGQPGADAPLTPSVQGETSFANANDGTPLEATGDAAARLREAVESLRGGEAEELLARLSAIRTPVTEADADRDLSSGDVPGGMFSAATLPQGSTEPKAPQAAPAAATPSLTLELATPKAPQAAPVAATPRSPTSSPYEQSSPEEADLHNLAPAAQGAGAQAPPSAWRDARQGDPPPARRDARQGVADARRALRGTQRQFDHGVDALVDSISDDEVSSDDEILQIQLRELQVLTERLAEKKDLVARKRAQRRAQRGDPRGPLPEPLADAVQVARLGSAATTYGDVHGDVHVHVHRGSEGPQWGPKPKDCKPLKGKERLAVPHGDQARTDPAIARALVLERERFTRAITQAFTDAHWDITAEGRTGETSRHTLFALVAGSIHADWDRLADWREEHQWASDDALRRGSERSLGNYSWYLRVGVDVPAGRNALATYVDFLIDVALGCENQAAMQDAAETMWHGMRFYKNVYDDHGQRRVPITAERFRAMALRCHSAYATARAAQGLSAPSVEEVRARLLGALPVNFRKWAGPARGLAFHGTVAAESDSERGAFDVERISGRSGVPRDRLTPVRFIEGACREIAEFFHRSRPHDSDCHDVWRSTDTAWRDEPERADLFATVSQAGSDVRQFHRNRNRGRASSRRGSDAGSVAEEPRVRAMDTDRPCHPNGRPKANAQQAANQANDDCRICEKLKLPGPHGHHSWCCPNAPPLPGFEASGSGS